MPTAKVEVVINRAFQHLAEYGPRFEILYGGAGSGKSYSVAQSIVFGALKKENKTRKYLCARKVAKTLRFSVYSLLRHIISECGLTPFFSINKSEMTITSVTGTEILMVGLDDVEKLKSIHGVTDIWAEEATEFAPDDMEQLNLRLRGPGPQKRFILTFNPVVSTHWIKRDFFDTHRDNVRIVKTTYHDNQFLDAEYKAELELLKDRNPYFYTVYALGEWGHLGNTVFVNFVIEDFDYTEDDLENVCAGMDYGFVHASVLNRHGYKDGELYTFDEVSGKGWTNEDFIEAALSHYGDALYDWNITADSAEPDRIEEWNRRGFRVDKAKKGTGSLRTGVDYLTNIRWHIHATNCPKLAQEVPVYQRREDKDGNVLEDKFVEFNDDCIAATRYATEHVWGQWQMQLADYSADDLGL